MDNKPKKQKHDYTSELELKSLLIRIKNTKEEKGTKTLNSRINKYIKYHTAVKNDKEGDSSKRSRIKNKLKERIVRDSEMTAIDTISYERFGEIILLMITNILKKPQFSGYTYRDDFFSDAVYKILKYLHNFDHTKISERTNQSVNSFSYITQIIHNSIIYIINTKNKENDRLKKQVEMENLNHSLQLKTIEIMKSPSYEIEPEENVKDIHITKIDESLTKELESLQDMITQYDRLNLYYPKDYILEYDEIVSMSELLQGKVSIIREK